MATQHALPVQAMREASPKMEAAAKRAKMATKQRLSGGGMGTVGAYRRTTNNRVLAAPPMEDYSQHHQFDKSHSAASSSSFDSGECKVSSLVSAVSSLVSAVSSSSLTSSSTKRSYADFAAATPNTADLVTPTTVDVLSPVPTPNTSSSCMDQLEFEECEEELEEMMAEPLSTLPEQDHLMTMVAVDEHMLPDDESDAVLSSHVATSAHAFAQNAFGLLPSYYRNYRGKEPLIVSVQTALEELNPELEMHMWDSEQQFQPYMFYLVYQSHLDTTMRPVLIDWMFEVAAEYCLARETVALAINYVDRFLGSSPSNLPADGTNRSVIDRQSLQLLGVTCLWIAAKVEEIDPPTPEDFAITTDNAYSAHQVLGMEPVVLRVLGWRLHAQTPYSFLRLYLKKAALILHSEFKRRAQILLEASVPNSPVQQYDSAGAPLLTQAQALDQLSMLQSDFLNELDYLLSSVWFVRMMELLDVLALDMHSLRFYPSQLAAAVLFVVNPPGSALYELITIATTYESQQLQPCIQLLQLFTDMKYHGPPPENRHSFMMDFKIPYDEFHSRQAHNPDALPILKAAFEIIAAGNKPTAATVAALAAANVAAAKAAQDAADAGFPMPPPPAPVVMQSANGETLGLEAVCHTNIFRNLPSFLTGAVWPELHVRKLVHPIRNCGAHRLPGLWVTDINARHDDPSSYGPMGLIEPTELELLLGVETAAIITAAAAASPTGGQSASAPIVPASDSFLAAAAKPFARMPKDAVRAGDRAAAAAAAAAAASQQLHSAATTAGSTTIYTFGGPTSSSSSASHTAASAAASNRAAFTHDHSSLSAGLASAWHEPQDEWLTSDDEDEQQ